MPRLLSEIIAEMIPTEQEKVEARSRELLTAHWLLYALQDERQQLVDRLENLGRYLYDSQVDGLDADSLQLLRTQKGIMINYVDVLEERISRLKEVQGG